MGWEWEMSRSRGGCGLKTNKLYPDNIPALLFALSQIIFNALSIKDYTGLS